MRHDWESYKPPGKSNAELFMGEPYRHCKNCGKVQQLYKDQLWGRIVSRQWLPLAGRCKLS